MTYRSNTMKKIISQFPAPEIVEGDDGKLYLEMLPPESEWVNLGICPAPQSTWRTFVYHVCHGMLMQYPLLDILVFSWQNRRSFTDEIVVDAVSSEEAA